MRIGILTGGGDCPGLNAVIRAVVRKGEGIYGHKIVGFRHGWRGRRRGRDRRAHGRVDPRDPAPGRHDPRHVAHESLQEPRAASPRCSRRSRASASTR